MTFDRTDFGINDLGGGGDRVDVARLLARIWFEFVLLLWRVSRSIDLQL